MTQVDPVSLSEIQAELLASGDTVLLEYLQGDERSYVWAVGPDFIHSHALPPRRTIEAAVHRLEAIATLPLLQRPDRSRFEWAARGVSRMLLDPVAEDLKAQRILFVGDGILQSVPFAALPVPNPDASGYQPLVSRYELASLPSASALVLQRRGGVRLQDPSRPFAILADPVFDRSDARVRTLRTSTGWRETVDTGRNYGRLIHARREFQSIWPLLPPGSNLKALDFNASKQLVLSGALEDYRFVHISTHALVNRTEPELSGLVFSLVDEEGASRDGFLRLNEIYSLKLKADLVVLSACESVAGPSVPGEGVFGLTRAFLHAGAKSVLASQWRIDAASTAELMRHFYKAILGPEHMRPAAALRAAQSKMWKEGWEPSDWAGFVLQGEW
jgi:CHAT domain-containing protein